MVAHDALVAKPHAGSFNAFGEDVFEGYEIEILFEYPEAAVGAVHDVVDDPAFSYALFPWHNMDDKQGLK